MICYMKYKLRRDVLVLITRKSEHEIKQMQRAGDMLVQTHKEIKKMIKPGITTMEIENFVEKFLKNHGATAEQKGFHGYKYATCTSINDEIYHCYPRTDLLKYDD